VARVQLADTDRTVKVEANHYPFCMMLRLALRRARVRAEWINIWDDPAAAAEVRNITGGDETVPTVVVGTRAMVNSSARQVIGAVRAGQPGVLPAKGIRPGPRLAQAAGFLTGRRPRPGHAVDEPGRHTPV
jgi:mycoredoxin